MDTYLWECPTLENKKTIGTGLHSYESTKEVIIDGQQRLTSLYAVMKNRSVINSNYDEKNIIISYHPLKNKFEVGYNATKKDPEWVYNVSDIFCSSTYIFINKFIKELEEYRVNKGNVLTDEEKSLIAENINSVYNLKNHTLPVFDIKSTAEEEDVSEIFVRVNSGGVSLKQNDFILTLLSLYWDEGRKLIEKFSKESRVYPGKGITTSYNQITDVSAQDLIRVVMAYGFDRARLKYAYKLLRGADFDKKGVIDATLRDQRFDTLKAKLPDVIDVHTWHEFIKSIMNAGYLSKL